ncbi:MAG: ABC transporter permease [Bacteroidales bacterium]|nr:ABC transporter permease [Bacteroidales bacterium]MCF8337314.1 ABC transporter permease [Bacteroidales bacterium]
MKRFLAFVKKEIQHIFRDTRTMLILFGIPIAQILIFGYVIKNDIKDVDIAVYDQSKDEYTRQITNKLTSSGYFILNRELDNMKNIDRIFKEGEVKLVVVYENNFSKKLHAENNATVQLIADASDPNRANLITNYSGAIIHDFVKDEFHIDQLPYQINSKVRMLYNQNLASVFMFVPGTMALILMLVSAMMTSISIAREKELGTMENLLVSPLRPAQIVVGKVTPYVLLSIINAITILVLGVFVFGLPIRGSLTLLMLESVLFITLSLSLGILISTMSPNQQVAMFISLFALMLPTLLLSGFIFPIENMPKLLQWLSAIMPPKYFITILKNIMLKGTGMAFVWKETLILGGMTAVFIILSVKKFKLRLE